MKLGPQPLALGLYVLLVIMAFLENKNMLLVLLIHYFCECSCFKINSMTKNFNSVSPFLLCCFTMKTCWCQQNWRIVSRDAYIFVSSYRLGIVVPSFIIVWYVWQILGRRVFLLPTIHEQPRKGPSWMGLRDVRKWWSSFTVRSQATT